MGCSASFPRKATRSSPEEHVDPAVPALATPLEHTKPRAAAEPPPQSWRRDLAASLAAKYFSAGEASYLKGGVMGQPRASGRGRSQGRGRGCGRSRQPPRAPTPKEPPPPDTWCAASVPRLHFSTQLCHHLTEHWSDVPVATPPFAPHGASLAGRLLYLEDNVAFADGAEHIVRARVSESSKDHFDDLNLVRVALREHGFDSAVSAADGWSIWWHSGLLREAESDRLGRFLHHQRINKFPGSSALTVKSGLAQCVREAARAHGSAFDDFMPLTFVLPAELTVYEALMRGEAGDGRYWILKPATQSRGTGIFLHRALPESTDSQRGYHSPSKTRAEARLWGELEAQAHVVSGGVMPRHVQAHVGVASRYVEAPYLIDGLKFDVRLYVLVTSVHPLVIYRYEQGLCRFATEPFDLSLPLDRRCMHLTNYSLNRKSSGFVPNVSEEEDGVGSKWSLAALRARLALELGAERAAAAWSAVDALIVKTIVAAEPAMVAAMEGASPAASKRGERLEQSFQLFGFDVMLDADAKPWLLEVNGDPSLGTGSPVDVKVKASMLVDALNVVGVPLPDSPPPPAAHPSFAPKRAIDQVDTEWARSRAGQWRRLLPCGGARALEYRRYLARRPLNALSFEVEPTGAAAAATHVEA